MKKLIIGSIIVLFIVFVWMVYSSYQTPSLKGYSGDKKWVVTYKPQISPKDIWAGKIKWNGTKSVQVTNVNLLIDGRKYTYFGENRIEILRSNESLEFASIGQPPVLDQTYSVIISWKEYDKVKKEEIRLKPVKQLFALPKF